MQYRRDLRERALSNPDLILYTYLADSETEAGSLTAAQLDGRAREVAAYLQQQGLTAQRVLLAYPTGLDFVVGLMGCLYAGVIAVPAFPPRRARGSARLEAIARDAGAVAVLTTGKIADESGPAIYAQAALKNLVWVVTDRPLGASANDWRPVVAGPTDLAYLQYTSGSAGTPKGVMVSHQNIIAISKNIQPTCMMAPDPRAVTWLPNFHDMGLIDGIIQPLYSGFTTYLIAPQAFVERPLRWLQAISRYRVTHSGAPDFGYRLCVDYVTRQERDTLDLSCWVNAYNGAEPIRRETLTRFADYFAPAGFQTRFYYPCYGMAETTLIVSGGPLNDEPTGTVRRCRCLGTASHRANRSGGLWQPDHSWLRAGPRRHQCRDRAA